jgi:hypothetical protein
MLKMLRGVEPIIMKGVEAYIKWKSAEEIFYENLKNELTLKPKDTPNLDGNSDDELPFGSKPNVNDKIELSFNSKSRFETTRDFLNGFGKRASKIGDRVAESSL